MRRQSLLSGMIVSLLLVASVAAAQGKGHARQKPDKPFEDVRGKSDKTPKPFKADKQSGRVITESGGEVERSGFRSFVGSNKRGEKLAGRAIANALKHGASEDAFVVSPVGRNVYILNPAGVLLANFDSDEELGTWKAVTLGDRDKKGAPSYCRSGAGHPVWGRQWCVDKGFGLGSDGDLRWSRVIEDDNVLFMRPVTPGELTRVALVDLLGDVVVNRLAAQAITLGLIEPLTGRWIGEPTTSRVLVLSSGARPVAEVVDLNRDNRADMLLVAVKP
jgi:hypothetical protein